MQLLYQFSGYSQYVIWLIILYLAFQKRYFWKANNRFFFYYIIATIFHELASIVTSYIVESNLFLSYISTPMDVMLLGLFLKGIIKNKSISNFINVFSILFVLFEVYNAVWGQGFFYSNSYGNFIENLYLVALSLWAYTVLFKEVDGKNIFKKPTAWFVLGILLIYATVLLSDYLYSISLELRNDNILYAVVIIPNFLKSAYLLLYLKGISLIEKK